MKVAASCSLPGACTLGDLAAFLSRALVAASEENTPDMQTGSQLRTIEEMQKAIFAHVSTEFSRCMTTQAPHRYGINWNLTKDRQKALVSPSRDL